MYPTPGDCIRLTVSAALHSFSTATARIRVSSHGTRRSCCIHCHQPLDAGSTFVRLESSWDRRVAISEASISCIAVGGYYGVGTFDQNADAWSAFNVWFDVVPAISGRSVTHPISEVPTAELPIGRKSISVAKGAVSGLSGSGEELQKADIRHSGREDWWFVTSKAAGPAGISAVVTCFPASPVLCLCIA